MSITDESISFAGKREDGALPALEGDLSRVFLVGAGEDRYMEELSRLAWTLGLEVVGQMEQNRRDGTGYIGRGKREELREEVKTSGAGVVITDDELTASQSRVLERDCDAPVVDRTELIIRIFHQHAHDAPSKLQVELAEVSYLLPRVRGMWRHLERLGGGSGGGSAGGSAGSAGSSAAGGRATRGPGEQQLEYDRRQLRERMERLKKRLSEESDSRLVRRSRLKDNPIPKVALVGYTNAGKTTVLNALSGADRVTRDRLFETLETTTRQVEGSTSQDGDGYTPDFTLTDTVGFIRKLPTQLVESFSSTLEAAEDADITILCADASSPEVEEEIAVVLETISKGLARNKKAEKRKKARQPENNEDSNNQIILLNKQDLIDHDREQELRTKYPDALFCDHVSGYGALYGNIVERIADAGRGMELLIPHSSYGDVTSLYGVAKINEMEETTAGVRISANIPPERASQYEKYRI